MNRSEFSYNLSWALEGFFALLLGLAALAARSMPRWLAAWAVAAGVTIEVGVAVPALFENLQPVFLPWLLLASGWALRAGRVEVVAAEWSSRPATATMGVDRPFR